METMSICTPMHQFVDCPWITVEREHHRLILGADTGIRPGNAFGSGDHHEIAHWVQMGLSPAQAIVVGDTPHDVEGAHAAGLACVGVGSHHFNVQQLRDAGADYAIASLKEPLPL